MFTGFFNWLAGLAVAQLLKQISAKLLDLMDKAKRYFNQKSAIDDIQKDVQKAAPRDDKTRKDEQTWLNS